MSKETRFHPPTVKQESFSLTIYPFLIPTRHAVGAEDLALLLQLVAVPHVEHHQVGEGGGQLGVFDVCGKRTVGVG